MSSKSHRQRPVIPYEDLGCLNAPFFAELQESFPQTLESGWYIWRRRSIGQPSVCPFLSVILKQRYAA